MIGWKCLLVLYAARSSSSCNGYFSWASLNFLENVLMTCLIPPCTWVRIDPIAYFWDKSGHTLDGRLWSWCTQSIAFATAASVALNNPSCSWSHLKGVSFFINLVMCSMMIAQLGISFLMALIIPRSPQVFLMWDGGTMCVALMPFLWGLKFFLSQADT